MYIVPEPIEVKAIERYKLYIKFKNGEEKIKMKSQKPHKHRLRDSERLY